MKKIKSIAQYEAFTGHQFEKEFDCIEYERFMKEFAKAYKVSSQTGIKYILIVAEHSHDQLAFHFLQPGMGPMFEFAKGKMQIAENLKTNWNYKEISLEDIEPEKITDILGYHTKWNSQVVNPFNLVHST